MSRSWPLIIVVLLSFGLGSFWGWRLIQERNEAEGRFIADSHFRLLAPAGLIPNAIVPEFENFDFNQAVSQSALDDASPIRHPAADHVYLIEEKERPGQLMPILEDEHGTYIMNSKDLRAIEHIEQLIHIGIDSFKIAGRTKSAYYVARTAQIYRKAIDDAVAKRPFDYTLLGQLENLANRGYTAGFYQRHASQETQNYLRGHSESNQSQYVGDITTSDNESNGMVEILVKNRFGIGDRLEIIHPSGNRIIELDYMQDHNGKTIDVAPVKRPSRSDPINRKCREGLYSKITLMLILQPF